MKVRYVGPFAAVDMILDGRDAVVAHGDVIDVDDETGVSLCQQADNWQPSGKAAKDAVEAASPPDPEPEPPADEPTPAEGV